MANSVQECGDTSRTRTVSSSEMHSKLREDSSARSEKSKVRCTEVRATVDAVEMQTERNVTQANSFLLAQASNDNNASASELDVAQEGRRDARIRPRAFHTGASLPLTPVVKYRVNCRGFVSIDMSTRCYQATRAMRQLCVCFWQRSFDVEVIWRGVSDVSEW